MLPGSRTAVPLLGSSMKNLAFTISSANGRSGQSVVYTLTPNGSTRLNIIGQGSTEAVNVYIGIYFHLAFRLNFLDHTILIIYDILRNRSYIIFYTVVQNFSQSWIQALIDGRRNEQF